MSEENEGCIECDWGQMPCAICSPCQHTAAKGRKGETGSWCIACGAKVSEVHDRPCGECCHFKLDLGANVMGICGPKLMTVTSTMFMTYSLHPDPVSRSGLCFEPKAD